MQGGAGNQGVTDPSKGTQAGGQGANTDPDEDDEDDEDEGKALSASAAAKLRKEAARRRVEAKALRDENDKLKAQGLSELDAAKKEAADSKKVADSSTRQLRTLKVGIEVRDLAKDLGITNPKLAVRLLDADDVEWDDDGEPKNVARLLKALLKEMPELKANGQGGAPQGGGADGGAGRQSGNVAGSGINDRLRAMTGRGTIVNA
jgi:hypothetical protein